MQTQPTIIENKEQMLQAFRQLLAEHKEAGPKTLSKQAVAQRAADQQLIETVSTYTVESIVKGLADLQLNFGGALDTLIAQLAVEAPKLEQLRRAIQVETDHLAELRNIRIAADTLETLIQEHQTRTAAFEAKSQQTRAAREHEIAETQQAWQQEQQEFEAALQERQTILQKQREQEETDYAYELQRQRKVEADQYAERKAASERQIAEEDARKKADWAARERILAEQQELLKKYKTLAETFPQELEAAVQKARSEAIAAVQEEAEIQTELFEKEVTSDTQVYELKIVSLQDTIAQQAQQIEQLAGQLQAALQQVQDLSAKALEGSRRAGKSHYEATTA